MPTQSQTRTAWPGQAGRASSLSRRRRGLGAAAATRHGDRSGRQTPASEAAALFKLPVPGCSRGADAGFAGLQRARARGTETRTSESELQVSLPDLT